MDLIKKYKSMYSDVHEYYHRLKEKITSVYVSALKIGWIMYVNITELGSKKLSSYIFKKINIVELFILQKKKVINGGNKINELLRGMIKSYIKMYNPEAYSTPKVVKYCEDDQLHKMTLLKSLDETLYQKMMFVGSQLRSKGDRRTKIDIEVAEILYTFRLNNKMGTLE